MRTSNSNRNWQTGRIASIAVALLLAGGPCFLAQAKAGKKLNVLFIISDDLNNEVARLATELRVPMNDLVKMIQAGGQDSIEELRTRILADKALDVVYRQAVIQG